MTEKEKMLAGKLYMAFDSELVKERKNARRLIERYNQIGYDEINQKSSLISELVGKHGSHTTINPPFQCDYGYNITIGDNFFANYDCVFIDVNTITIGNNVMFGPKVCLYTAGHPIDAEVRNLDLEFGYPIKIGDNVWIGGNTVVNPGVSIGNNTVIGSGSVVTKDIPSNVIAVGNPCKVLRNITDSDKEYWSKLKDEYEKNKGKT